MEYHIRLNQVSRTFTKNGVPIHALDGVDLTVRPGEWLLVVGVSGSGKSTMLQLIGGLDRPSQGQILCKDVDLTTLNSDELATYRRQKVGFIFQSFNLIPTLTALENVCLPFVPYGVARHEMETKASAALEHVGMTQRANHLPGELSGGEQQRVAIARALVNEPELLLADEPTGELDSRTGDRIMELIESLHRERGVTIIMTSHDPRIAEKAPSVVRLEDGKLVEPLR